MSIDAPFPYFGGKKSVAHLVWEALGDVQSYVEPFAGSAAVLLGRPDDHRPVRETINDADGYVSNFWRAIAADPDAVAAHADWPVMERDLEARHYWLVTEGRQRLAAIMGDPAAYDAQVAGWWVWGACAWIAAGWCSGAGPWAWSEAGWVGNAGRGINRQLPHLGNAGQGINRKLPHLGDAGRGINRQLPHPGDAGQGEAILTWFRRLAARLRRVVVTCGDWRRVVASPSVLGANHCASVGVFLDPPYGSGTDVYAHGGTDVHHAVRDWCAAADPAYRIVLAGYAGDGNEALRAGGWREMSALPKRSGAGYANLTGKGGAGANRQRERLWLSPACAAFRQDELFAAAEPAGGAA